jgi:hypothetical protein
MINMIVDARKRLKWIFICALLVSPLFGQEIITPSNEEKEQDLLDFEAIRSVIQSDMLTNEVEQKQVQVQQKSQARVEINKALFNVPTENDFWSFLSEYWLVKNAPVLRWDFSKPDYGIAPFFESFLEKMGYYNQGFKLLLINSPSIPHMALPSDPDGDAIFVLSVPFIRTLDLSKQEIALLLFENFLRHRQGYFRSMVLTPELTSFLGSNFQGTKLDKTQFDEAFKAYDKVIFEQGFQFQQQFEITRQMDQILKNDLQLWNVYYGMIAKIDTMVKSNTLYTKYNQIYPSTELQLNWLRPKKTIFR